MVTQSTGEPTDTPLAMSQGPRGERAREAEHLPGGLHHDPALLRALLAAVNDGILVVDESERIVVFSRGAERMFGVGVPAVSGAHISFLIPGGLGPQRGAAHLADALDQPPAGIVRCVRASGEPFTAEVTTASFTTSDGRYLLAILRDMSAQLGAEREHDALLTAERSRRNSAESEARVAAFLSESSRVLDATLDYEATLDRLAHVVVPRLSTICLIDIIEEDGSVRRLQALHADAAKQELIDGLVGDSRSPGGASLTRHALSAGESELVPEVTPEWLRTVSRDDVNFEALSRIQPASVVVVPLLARGRTLGALALINDFGARRLGADDLVVAKQVAAQAALAIDNARLYKLAQKATLMRDTVLATVSHDLRNPLSAIAMAASALVQAPSESAVANLATTIHESAHWMQRLIQDLLDVAKIDAGRLSLERRAEDPVIIAARAATIFEGLAAERSIGLHVRAPDRLPAVFVDAARTLQVLANLLHNALKFTPADGTITIEARAEAEHVVMSVADTGPGIPSAEQPLVFERFWHAARSAREPGSGLGLSIAKGIVEAQGGRIWVESAPGAGSTFLFTLPQAAGERSV